MTVLVSLECTLMGFGIRRSSDRPQSGVYGNVVSSSWTIFVAFGVFRINIIYSDEYVGMVIGVKISVYASGFLWRKTRKDKFDQLRKFRI